MNQTARLFAGVAFGVLGLLAAGPATAEPAPATLTVDRAVEAALANNLSVQSAAVQERIRKRASDFSFNKFYPNLSATITGLRLNDPGASTQAVPMAIPGVPSSAAVGTYFYDYSYKYVPEAENLALGLTVQEIFSPVYLLVMDQAAIEYQKSTLTRAKAEAQMTAAVKKLFFQLTVQDQAIAVTQARLDNALERLRQAQVAFDLGQGSELNAMYAKANAEGLVPDLQAMKRTRALALVKFQEMLGFDRRDDMGLEGGLEDQVNPSTEGPSPLGPRFDALEARLTVKQLTSALRLQDVSLLPNVVVQFTSDPVLNNPNWDRAQDSSNWKQKTGALSLTLSWSLTGFLPGSELQIKRAEVADQLALAEETVRRTVDNAVHDEENQRSLIRDSLAKIENLQKVVDASQRVYDLSQDSYKAGVGRYLDLQAAELSWQGSQIQLLNERLNLMSLVWDLEAKYYPVW